MATTRVAVSLGVVQDAIAGPFDIAEGTGDVVFQVYGTWTGTITWEGKVTGVPDVAANWLAVQATPLGTGTVATTTTVNGIFRINASGIAVRGRLSTPGTGSASVVGNISDAN